MRKIQKYLFICMLCIGIGGHFLAFADVAKPARKPRAAKIVAPKHATAKHAAPKAISPKPFITGPKAPTTVAKPNIAMHANVVPPDDNTIVTVGPSGDYTKIQDAIDAFVDGNAGFTTIQIAPGVYDEQLYLEGITSGANFQFRPSLSIGIPPQNLNGSPNDVLLTNQYQGLQILGDTRPFTPGKYYINGYENANGSVFGPDFFPTYEAQNGYLLYPPLGTNYAISNLSLDATRTVLTVTMSDIPLSDPFTEHVPFLEQPVFDSIYLDIQPGDQVILSESNVLGNYQSVELSIASVSGNTITFSTPVPAVGQPHGVDFSKPGASITFLPRVIVRPTVVDPLQPNIMTVNNASFSMNGICFDLSANYYNSGSFLWGLLINDSEALLANVVVTNQNSGGFIPGTIAAAYNFISSQIQLVDGWRGNRQSQKLVSVGWPSGYTLTDSSLEGDGFIFATQSYTGGMEATAGSSINVRALQLLGALGNGLGCLSLGLNEYGVSHSAGAQAIVFDVLSLADSFSHGVCLWASKLYVNNPAVRVERCYNVQLPVTSSECDCCAVYISQDSQFSIYTGFISSNVAPGVEGAPFTVVRSASVFSGNRQVPTAPPLLPTSPQTAICVDQGGIFNTEGDLIFENNDVNYATYQIGIFNAPKYSLSPNNVYQLQAPQTLNNAFLTQAMTPAASVITMDPGQINPCGGVRPWYEGKTYTLYSKTADKHSFKLLEGMFIGSLGQGTKIKFLDEQREWHCGKKGECKSVVGAYVTFKVIDDQTVLVTDHYGVKMAH